MSVLLVLICFLNHTNIKDRLGNKWHICSYFLTMIHFPVEMSCLAGKSKANLFTRSCVVIKIPSFAVVFNHMFLFSLVISFILAKEQNDFL